MEELQYFYTEEELEEIKNPLALNELLQYFCGVPMQSENGVYMNNEPDLAMVKKLLARGADPTVDNNSCIMAAAQRGYVEVIQLLLNTRADILKYDAEDLVFSPLISAANNGHLQVVVLLLEYCKWSIDVLQVAVECAIVGGHGEVVSLLETYF